MIILNLELNKTFECIIKKIILYHDKATSINFTTGMEVTIITSGNAKTVVFTPVK